MEELDDLYRRRRKLTVNRNICAAAGCLLIFYLISMVRDGAPIYFPIIMGVMVAVLIFLGLKANAVVKQTEKEIEEMESAKEAVPVPVVQEKSEEDTPPRL